MSLRRRLFEILEISRPGDRASLICDVVLITLVGSNVFAVVVESVATIDARFHGFFRAFEIFSTGVFTLEYCLRIWTSVEADKAGSHRPLTARLRFLVTPLALVDLVAILPFYLSSAYAIDLRFMRVLRLLRLLKLTHYFKALANLLDVFIEEARIFGAAVFLLVVLMLAAASGVYIFEHQVQPEAFGSIPAAMWWAMATLTTVGYGDVTPVTVAGKVFGSCITVVGIGMAALPAGILASGLSRQLQSRRRVYARELGAALEDGHVDASERAHLVTLRAELGLREEDTDDLPPLETGPGSLVRPDQRGILDEPDTCPSCGKPLGL